MCNNLTNMTEKKDPRGGRRNPPGGRPPPPGKEGKEKATFRLTPQNPGYLPNNPLGKRGELINRLLDGERKKTGNDKQSN